MCSAAGLPPAGSTLTLRVSSVEIRPEVVPVRLWGLVGERREDYPVPGWAGRDPGTGGWAHEPPGCAPGPPDGLCLVRFAGCWHRGRVVGRQAGRCRVFLLDEGRTVTADPACLAPALPRAEALGCVLAGLVPAAAAGGGEPDRWSRAAAGFLARLRGKEVEGRVLDVLLPQRLVLLDVPALARQMHELGLVRPVSDRVFRALLKRQLTGGPESPPAPGPPGPPGPPDPPATVEFFHPGLRPGPMERMVVTQVSHPHRVYCQLLSFSGEVARLADGMAVAYGGPAREAGAETPARPGAPCATRGPDGRWHRAVLLDASGPQRPAQVLHVDSGRKELVSGGSLRALLPEYFRLPVVTYPCALYGLWDRGRGWARSQVSRLRTLLLGRTVSVKVEFYSTLERVYYVTLYGDEGLNLNGIFGVQARCLADRMPLGPGPENEAGGGEGGVEEEEEDEEEEEPPDPPKTPLASSSYDELPHLSLKVIQLKAEAFYDARVEFAKDPSEFWVRLRRHNEPFGQLARSMCSFYSSVGKMDGVLAQPQPDRVCCVRWMDGNFFRAVIARPAAGGSVEVRLLDRGDAGVVGSDDVKELLPQFWQLPIVALKCSLADVCPVGGEWSPEAVSYFRKVVLHKEVVIRVLGKEGSQYAVEIFDTAGIGEENVGRRLARAGYAARVQEPEEVEVATPSVRSARRAVSRRGAGARGGGAEQEPEEGNPRQLPAQPPAERGSATNPVSEPTARGKERVEGPPTASSARRDYRGTDSRHPIIDQLEVGSTVEVKVTFVENPGKFWCQLTRNIQELRGLMSEMQEYCKTSATPHRGTGPACLAKRAENGKWCRALITGEALHPEQVEIMFVDYGNREVVSVKNLYAIREDFLKLKAQAFRCSLYNLIRPTGPDPLAWDETATVAFRDFVGGAWERNLELKCTVFAVASLNRKELFHIVDLVTPFQSACHCLTEKGHAKPMQPQNPLASAVRLESYYYSTHDIKIGGEEAICVTHIDDPSAFYCQLARSVTVLERLSRHISQVAQLSQNLRTKTLAPGTLCLAKYNDQNWYRAIVTEKETSKEVFFVDFGNTYEVTHDDLLPLPGDAYNLLLLPMQAIKCCLSDAYDHIPKEVALWFEKAVLDKPLKAMVVAKDPEGRLVIELYGESVQINAKLNEKLSLLGYKSSPKLVESDVLLSTVAGREEKSENRKSPVGLLSKSVESTGGPSEIPKESSRPKISLAFKELKPLQSSTKATLSTEGPDPVDDRELEAAIFGDEVEGTPCQSPIKPTPKTGATIPGDHGHNEESPLKLCDLPRKNIVPGLKTRIYVSHVNDLSDFYVQLTEDELELGLISEKLNGPATRPDSVARPPYQVEDLICAVFSEDDLWYRAVITEKPSGDLIPVQFIDYGNTSVVKASEISRLVGPDAVVPGMSIHCSLGRIPLSEMTDCPESVAYFSQRTNEAQLNCEFVKQVGGTWEVILHDEQGVIAEELMARFKPHEGPRVGETPAPGLSGDDGLQSSLLSWCRPDVKTLRAYATVIDGPAYFWCQFAETPNLKRLEREVQKAGARAVEGADRMEVVQQGDACIVKCRDDGKFYRALVARVRRDLITVRLVDYGNVESFGREVIWHIPEELLSIPMQAFPCCLAGLHALEGVCSAEAKNYFFEIVTRDVLDVTVVEFRSDACNVPLAVVGLKCNGESIGEKMKKFSKFDTANRYTVKASFSSTWPERKKDRRIEAPQGQRPEVGTGERRRASRGRLLCPELSSSDRYLNDATDGSETSKGNTGVEPKDVAPACRTEKAKVDESSSRTSALEPLSPQESELKMFELDSLEIPLSLDDESKEFVELESLELQLSLAGDEPKEELDLRPPVVQLSQSFEVKFLPLESYSVPLSLGYEADDLEAEPQALQFPVDDDVQSIASEMSPKDQEVMHVEDLREPSHAKSFDCETRRISLRERNRGSEIQSECTFYEVFGDYRNIIVEFQTGQFSDEESSTGEDEEILSTEHVAGENVYSLDGFTVGSKCVVWSNLEKRWSECQILEITEDGTKVLNLLNGIEDLVSPENVWNGIPKSDKNPYEVVFDPLEEDACSNPLEDPMDEDLPLVLPAKSSANDLALSMKAEMGPSNSDNTLESVRSSLQELNQEGSGERECICLPEEPANSERVLKK